MVLITRAIALITRCIDSDAHHWLAVAHRHLTGTHRHLTVAHRHLTGTHRHLTGTHRHVAGAHSHLSGAHCHLGLLLLTQHLIFALKLVNLLVLLLDPTQKLVFALEYLNRSLLSRFMMMVYLVLATNRCCLIIEWARVPPFLVLFFDTFHLCLCISFDTFV